MTVRLHIIPCWEKLRFLGDMNVLRASAERMSQCWSGGATTFVDKKKKRARK